VPGVAAAAAAAAASRAIRSARNAVITLIRQATPRWRGGQGRWNRLRSTNAPLRSAWKSLPGCLAYLSTVGSYASLDPNRALQGGGIRVAALRRHILGDRANPLCVTNANKH
jgi:hypothetical protein